MIRKCIALNYGTKSRRCQRDFLLLLLRVFRNMTIFAVGNLNYTMYKIIQAEYAGKF